MFQFPRFALNPYFIQGSIPSADSCRSTPSRRIAPAQRNGSIAVEGGFPHSEIRGSKLVRSSPRLIAAYHVLHRLSAPRHPPNALKTLDCSHDQCPRRSPGTVIVRKTSFACRTCPVTMARSRLAGSPHKWQTEHVPSSRCQYACRRSTTIGRVQPEPALLSSGRFQAARDPHAGLVEPDGIEPTTSCVQSRRSPS